MSDDTVEGVINTSGDMPSVNWTQLASTFVGAIALGWFYGVIGLVNVIYSGITNSITRVNLWVSATLIPELFDGILGALEVAATETELFLGSLGPFAPVGALTILAIITVIVVRTIQAAIRIVVGVI